MKKVVDDNSNPDELIGLFVLEDGQRKSLEMLGENVMSEEIFEHS